MLKILYPQKSRAGANEHPVPYLLRLPPALDRRTRVSSFSLWIPLVNRLTTASSPAHLVRRSTLTPSSLLVVPRNCPITLLSLWKSRRPLTLALLKSATVWSKPYPTLSLAMVPVIPLEKKHTLEKDMALHWSTLVTVSTDEQHVLLFPTSLLNGKIPLPS